MSEIKNLKRNHGIDLFRGLAILSVILLHVNTQLPFSDTYLGRIIPISIYKIIFWRGYYGVCTFFVISGFLITNTSLNRWETIPKASLREFYAMQFARIMPMLIALLLILSLLHLFGVFGFVINPNQTSLVRSIMAVLTFYVNWLEIKVGYLPASWDVLWSLSIEEMFYIFFPILCFVCRKEWHFIEQTCLSYGPDSRKRIIRNNITEVAYYVQTTVEAKNNLPIDYKVTNHNESKAMGNMLQRVKSILRSNDFTALYDKGYYTGSEFDIAEKPGNGRCFQQYKTVGCKGCPVREKCTKSKQNGKIIQRRKYAQNIEANRKRIENDPATYKKRQAIAEHPFGTIKRQWGFSYILTKKYLHRASADVGFIMTAYNLRRIINIIGTVHFKEYLQAILCHIYAFFNPIDPIRCLVSLYISKRIIPETIFNPSVNQLYLLLKTNINKSF